MPQPLISAASHLLPRVPVGVGERRVANLIFRRRLENRHLIRRRRLAGRDHNPGPRFDLDLADWPQAQAFLLRRYDPATVEFVREHLPKGGTFIDAGAHVGLISLQVAGFNPTARIHAFEPHPAKHAQLARNVNLNAPVGMTVNQLGLSDTAGHLAYDTDRHAIDRTATGTIPVVTLDNYMTEHTIERVDVLKLDIEGHELQALHGAQNAIRDHAIRAVATETLHGDIDAPGRFLEQHGYKRVQLPDPRPGWIKKHRPANSENAGYVL